MKSYTIEEFRRSLDALDMSAGDTVFVHAALFRLGRLQGVDFEDIARTLCRSLLDHLGPDGTVVVPVFQYEGLDFFKNYRSRQMGPIAEYIAGLPESCRTWHTVFSIAAWGRLAAEIAEHDALSAFASDGPFEFLLRQNAKILLLGTGVEAASVVHLIEERVGVPYRYWMDFPSTRPAEGNRGRGEPVERGYRMFVRDLDKYPTLAMDRIGQWLDQAQVIKRCWLGGGQVTGVSFTDYVACVQERLERDRLALVR